MKKLINRIVDERKVILFLALIVAIAGSYAYYVLPRQEMPDVSVPFAMIITSYPGASAEDVNDLVTEKIEDELYEIDGYDYTQSVSKDSVSIVSVAFDLDVDTSRVYQDVRNAVNDAQKNLPDGANPSEVNTDLMETAGIVIALAGDNYTYEQLESFGEQFKDELTGIHGISKFNIEGKINREVKVRVNIEKLNQFDLSLEDLSQLLRAQNIEIPSGSIDTEHGEISVKTPGVFTSIKDIENMIIAGSKETGVVARLGDVADIEIGLEDGVSKYKQDGVNAVLLTGYFKQSENIVLIGDEVRSTIDSVKGQLPKDLEVVEVVYQPDEVSDSVKDFMLNLLQGILFVIVVVFIGMSFRNALVASLAVPLSILATFGVMLLANIYIHQISLTALIIALGILVDNAIVVTDAIQVKIDGGMNALEASKEGAFESSVPIFTATLTTIAAFSPLLGLPGVAGDFLGTIPWVLIISIIAAFFVALLVTPAAGAIFLKPSKKDQNKEGRIRKFFNNMLRFGLKFKKTVVIGVFIILFLVVNFIMPMLPNQFFPIADKDLLTIELTTEKSNDLIATEEFSDQVIHTLKDVPEIKSYTTGIGDGIPKFYVAMMPPMPSKDYGQIVCQYELNVDGEQRFNSREELTTFIQSKIDQEVTAGKAQVNLLQMAKPGAKIVMHLSHENMDQLIGATTNIRNALEEMPGLKNVTDDLKDKTFDYNVDVDEEVATALGVTKYDIQRQVNIALYGTVPSVFRRDGNEYDINLKSDIESIEMLKNLEIKSSITGAKIPLKQFADISLATKVDSINRYDRRQTITIEGENLPKYNAVTLEDTIEYEIIPEVDLMGAKVSYDGERESIAETFGVVGLLAAAAIALIYIILVVQFNSFIQPIVILVTIPLSLIGSVIGLYLLDKPLSLTAFLGIIALIGLVVKNGILLIEYINDARKEDQSINDACIDAVSKRFNPIILSAATTVMGLLPLALSGGTLFAPMAIALMSGLIVSTFLTMVVIPVIYSLIETFIENKQLRWKKE